MFIKNILALKMIIPKLYKLTDKSPNSDQDIDGIILSKCKKKEKAYPSDSMCVRNILQIHWESFRNSRPAFVSIYFQH